MEHLMIRILELNSTPPWKDIPNFEGETKVEEVAVLVGGMVSGNPSVSFNVPTNTGWVVFQMTYGNLKTLAAAVEGIAARTKTPTGNPQ